MNNQWTHGPVFPVGERGDETATACIAVGTWIGRIECHGETEEDAISLRDSVMKGTPAAEWREKGEPDPHGDYYDCERARLCHGDLTDDQIANAVYLHPTIGYLTAAKERIRWLSRALEAAKKDEPDDVDGNAAAVAAIQFALETDCGLDFLRSWNEGDFESIRGEWPEAPESIYVGADPLYVKK